MVLLYFFFFQNLLYLKLFMYVVFIIWFRFCFEQSQCYRQGRVQVLQGPPPPPHGRQLQARLCSSERQDLEQGFNQRQHLKNTLTKEISIGKLVKKVDRSPFLVSSQYCSPRIGWYCYSMLKGFRGEGQSLGDMSPKKSIFLLTPSLIRTLYICFVRLEMLSLES